MTNETSGYCTRLCAANGDCPDGYECRLGVWTKYGKDTGRGRVEQVCGRKRAGEPSQSTVDP